MTHNVILITGTPGTGKTVVAKRLTRKLKARYVNLTELGVAENLTTGQDNKRDTTIIDETLMKNKLRQIIRENRDNPVIIDGHYSPSVAPKKNTSIVFVLRRNPIELRKIMKKRGYSEAKQSENLESEILDVCLIDALNDQPKAKVCEIETTQKTPAEIVDEMLAILDGKVSCCTGVIDWIGKLEKEGMLKDYLRI